MNITRPLTVPVLILGLVAFPQTTRAQVTSDRLFEGITNHLGEQVVPGLSYTILEGVEGTQAFAFPALTVDFIEPTTNTVSDRFHFDPYIVNVQSDQNPNGLPPRPGAVLIPFAALERFTPVFIAGGSDGDPQGPDSDRLTIVAGAYVGFPGVTLLDLVLPESPEPQGEFAAFGPLALSFDVEEPDEGQPGWHPGIISDYVDVINLQGFFLSSDDPSNPHYQGPANGTIIEKNAPEWGRLDYRLNFESDVIPEPGSMLLLGIGFFSAACRRRAVTREATMMHIAIWGKLKGKAIGWMEKVTDEPHQT